jgi:hypothetical protein
MIRVVNKKTYKGDGVYVGRPSALGNPFVIGRDGSRDEVIAKYKEWLAKALMNNPAVRDTFMQLVSFYRDFGELTLVCFCKPQKCHADIIKEFIENEVREEL